MSKNKVWLVTGASKGLGLILVKKLLSSNYRVAATSRTVASLIDEIGDVSDSFFPIEMDVTSDNNVKGSINKVVDHFGTIDVVVNNAGFGQIGTLEELSDGEAKNSFDVNVFGCLNVIRHATPILRKQESGHIFNISSIGGYIGNFPGFGVYCATKFAVSGFTEALAEEMKGFGVNVTLVYPGYFRTNFLSKGSVKTPVNPIEAYSIARESEQAHLNQINGNQPNDPEKAAEVMIAVSEQEAPLVHLFLGKDAYQYAGTKIDLIQKEMEGNEALGTSTEILSE
ncbi:SDR family oxidoreductase [Fulvivirga sp. M361]|uniref:SDR family oxidoreductase n=1 Tax=Fulvivirga sp. M361 TaxID=2594266 RepID=UPI00117A831B|nr:SDR family oxidoreductase [Fulvivirga sp. M361]TRX54346.1 SDR family oxidoreductase [Fulvivirga sp. M361]